MMIIWIQKFHCKFIFQFDFHTGGPYQTLFGIESAIFQEYGWILSRNFFFKVNIPCILLFCIQADIALL